MEKPVNIEKIKSFIIVVLFLTTILLLSFFWKSVSFDRLPFAISSIGETPPQEMVSVQSVVRPTAVLVNFGSGAYTFPNSGETEIWKTMASELALICDSETVLLEEITAEQYAKVMQFRSIEAVTPYEIPFTEFCDEYQIKRHQSLDAIQTLSRMAFSTGSPESFLLQDKQSGLFYRLVADRELTALSKQIDSIEAEPFSPYYEVSTFFGVKNTSKMPVSLQTRLENVPYEQEVFPYETEKIKQLAESFFGSSFDFIRKITESNGSVIYMYGYGQKLFSIDRTGSLEYKEELASTADSQTGFFESLDLALKFNSAHLTEYESNQLPLSLYLESATPIERDKKSGYRFVFGMDLAEDRIYYESGAPLILEIIGNQVVYYKRDQFVLTEDAVRNLETTMDREAFSVANVLAENYKYISRILTLENKTEGAAAGSSYTFEAIAERVSEVRTGYLKPALNQTEKSHVMTPVWVVNINGIQFYFDIDDADEKGYSILGK